MLISARFVVYCEYAWTEFQWGIKGIILYFEVSNLRNNLVDKAGSVYNVWRGFALRDWNALGQASLSIWNVTDKNMRWLFCWGAYNSGSSNVRGLLIGLALSSIVSGRVASLWRGRGALSLAGTRFVCGLWHHRRARRLRVEVQPVTDCVIRCSTLTYLPVISCALSMQQVLSAMECFKGRKISFGNEAITDLCAQQDFYCGMRSFARPDTWAQLA